MMKKIVLSLLLIILAGLVWYLFIKKYDYQFETTAKYGPGAVSYELSEWKSLNDQDKSGKIEVVDRDNFNSLTQRVELDSSKYLELNWELEKKNDSITAITLNVVSQKNKLGNRFDIVNPFQNSRYIDSLKGQVINFKKVLLQNQTRYRITPEKELADSPEMKCVCSSSKNIALTDKASEMMRTIAILENYILENRIDLNGYPFLKVTNWDIEKDLIDFNFCFPVSDISNLMETNTIRLKKYPSKKALKLIFNGNYRLSHVSWFDLFYLAGERGYEPDGWPMEVYHDNPKIDMNELQWIAEVYLPVKE